MYGWIKYFADGTKEVGTDEDVRMKRASWSRGRLAGMVAASTIHGNKKIAILFPGKFWQSDDYDVDVFEPTPSLRVRRLQRQIGLGDQTLVVIKDAHTFTIEVLSKYHRNDATFGLVGHEGKWITVEYDLQTQQCSWRLEENRI